MVVDELQRPVDRKQPYLRIGSLAVLVIEMVPKAVTDSKPDCLVVSRGVTAHGRAWSVGTIHNVLSDLRHRTRSGAINLHEEPKTNLHGAHKVGQYRCSRRTVGLQDSVRVHCSDNSSEVSGETLLVTDGWREA